MASRIEMQYKVGKALLKCPGLTKVLEGRFASSFPLLTRERIIVALGKASEPEVELSVAQSLLDLAEPVDVMVHLRLVKDKGDAVKTLRRKLVIYTSMNKMPSIPSAHYYVESVEHLGQYFGGRDER